MSVDRYIAVCHSFSDKLQKLRKKRSALCITLVTWITSILLCIPIGMYSTKSGIEPNCKCQLVIIRKVKNVISLYTSFKKLFRDLQLKIIKKHLICLDH